MSPTSQSGYWHVLLDFCSVFKIALLRNITTTLQIRNLWTVLGKGGGGGGGGGGWLWWWWWWWW